ncbi:Pimeloyl-ACP methyl ester carboxylesterase [Pedococcus dokdonensis]|uniref:Pimeloyl-ACP methyl ester carboxylesterase n=1 Tax=Pedococcus dokdonensis TaxID=443156 RepID=A0A1H0LQF5_9MICO|nr:alpha/beta fold hydrolase [Pedococcus dokdonensis]SDO70394.1 Pimeloyl-ACP methyl ester carboxylesterase [Pedococcus dokdonensis]
MLLSHDDEGSGPAVVLLHAGVADRRMWDAVAPVLAHTFRVIRPDLRGFGQTPMPPEKYADADDVDALMDSLGVTDAAVVGSSFGGRVAMELATLHPTRVSSLVLMCTAYRGLEPTESVKAFGQEEDRLLEAGDVAGATELNVRTFLGPEADGAARALLTLMQRRAFDVQLAADEADPGPEPRRVEVDPTGIAVPTVVVSGAHDLDHFGDVARLLGEQIPGAETVELDWAGHLPALERPDAVQALLLDVLRDDPTVHAP